jgi:hypothetical protein
MTGSLLQPVIVELASGRGRMPVNLNMAQCVRTLRGPRRGRPLSV